MLPLVSPDKDMVYEGQNVDLKCSATGRPPPTYKWVRKAVSKSLG